MVLITLQVRTFAALQAYFYRCRSELTQTRPMFNLSHTTELPHPNEELSGDVFNPESWRPVLQVSQLCFSFPSRAVCLTRF